MKRLLLATAALVVLSAPALADNIIATARVDGTLVSTSNSATGSLNIVNQSYGPIFNMNSLTANSQSVLATPGILSTNTFNVNQILGGTHDLVIDVVALGLTGTGLLTNLLVRSLSRPRLMAGLSESRRLINNELAGGYRSVHRGLGQSVHIAARDREQLQCRGTTPSCCLTQPTVAQWRLRQCRPRPVGAGLPGIIAGFGAFLAWGIRRRKADTVAVYARLPRRLGVHRSLYHSWKMQDPREGHRQMA